MREEVLKVDPREHILVCQMSHQQGVACKLSACFPPQLMFSPQDGGPQKFCYCGTSSLCIQASLINSSLKHTSDKYVSINAVFLKSYVAAESLEGNTFYDVSIHLFIKPD